jgi:predicted RNase H-like HicB family nuclease
MENRIKEYLKKPYSRILTPDPETGRYAAQILEFPGCFSEGLTPQKAYKNLEQAAYNWLESAINQGMEIPAPFSAEGYSGKIALRLPKSLHRQAIYIAKREGVSLNQFLVSSIAASVGAENLYQQITDRLDAKIAVNASGARLPISTGQWDYLGEVSSASPSPGVSGSTIFVSPSAFQVTAETLLTQGTDQSVQ